MTHIPAAEPSPCLYSQTDHDERGNFHYQGDLYRQGEVLSAICLRIDRHLGDLPAGTQFSIRNQTFGGGRKIIVELLDTPVDLTDDIARRAYVIMIRDQVERFGFTRSNLLQDFWTSCFYTDVRIGTAYWAAFTTRRGRSNPVTPTLSLAAFKRRLKPGDRLKLIAAPEGHRALGTTHVVIAVRSNDLIFEGKVYLDFPRASAFAWDGRRVRIANGNEQDPDRHLLYEWLPPADVSGGKEEGRVGGAVR